MPAMDVNDNAGRLNERVAHTLFAGKPAPTGNRVRFCFSPLIRPSVSSPSAFDLSAPSRGRVEVLRSGQPGRDAGLAAPGHGWPRAAGPRSRTGTRACRALARHRTKGAKALWLLSRFSKVTRRKGGTLTRYDRRNGYVHHHKSGQTLSKRCHFMVVAMISTRLSWVKGLDSRGSLVAKPSRRSA